MWGTMGQTTNASSWKQEQVMMKTMMQRAMMSKVWHPPTWSLEGSRCGYVAAVAAAKQSVAVKYIEQEDHDGPTLRHGP